MFDVAPIEPLAFPIFTPLFGFATISSPEITLEVHEISEGNWHFKRKIVKRGDASNITCTRGVTWYDSDFWRWTITAMLGDTSGFKVAGSPNIRIGGPTYRRTMILIHFFSRAPFDLPQEAAAAVAAGVAGTVGAVAGAGTVGTVIGAAAAGLGALVPGPFQFAARLPAKAFILNGCVPVRYKSGGDFDASTGQVSIAEIEMALESIEEVSLTA